MIDPPYQELHIYYIQGRVRPSRILDGCAGFIGNWEEEGDSFLFFSLPAEGVVTALLTAQPRLAWLDTYQMSYDDWQGGAIRPLTVGRLHIAAPWHPLTVGDEDRTILLDPGVVFGTGTHATTQDCLTALQLAMDREPVRRVADLGTGTGLLALSAAHLGAREVVAVDLNHLAVRTARNNVGLNHMQARIVVVQGNAMNFMDLNADLMVSNIHYAVMRKLITTPGFFTHKQYVLSGLLRSQAKEIENLLRRCSTILQKWERDGIWYTYWGCNR